MKPTPFSALLGVREPEPTEGGARLHLPHDPANTNDGRMLHGGAAAALASLAAEAAAAGRPGSRGAWHTSTLHVSYLRAARETDVVADATRVRGGRDLCFVELLLRGADRRPVAQGLATVRAGGREGEGPRPQLPPDGDPFEGAERAARIDAVPYLARLGIRLEHMARGSARLRLPFAPRLADGRGGLHPAALLGLADASGAVCSHTLERRRGATVVLQAQLLGDVPPEDLLGLGRCVHHADGTFWNHFDVVTASARHLVARGHILYRMLR